MPFFTTEDTGTDNATGDSLPVSLHDATWAHTFLPSANGDQRIRYQNDEANFVGQLQAQQAAHQADVMAHDVKGAQVLHTQAAMEAQKQQHDFEMQMQPLRLQELNGRIAAQQAQEQRRLDESILNNKKEEQTNLAHWELNQALHPDSTISPNDTRAWIDTLPQKYPHAMASTDFRERYNQVQQGFAAQDKPAAVHYFKGSDGAVYGINNQGTFRNGQPVDSVPEGISLSSHNPVHVGNALVDANGRVLYSAPAADDTAKRLTHLENLRGRTNLDADQKAYFDAEINKLKQAGSPAAAPTITTPGGTSMTLPAQTQSAPVIPADHAAFLRAHPEKAASFDQTYGAGASAKILGQ